MDTSLDKYWNPGSTEDLFQRLIGSDYGQDPHKQEARIAQDKLAMAKIIMRDLKIQRFHVGAEIGVGMGYMAKAFAHRVAAFWGFDISQGYLTYASHHCRNAKNISWQLITPGKLTGPPDGFLDFVYANNVFVHLSFFEIYTYLTEINRLLKAGGRVWFDFCEVERTDFRNDSDFLQSLRLKAQDFNHRGAFEYNSLTGLRNAMTALGFQITEVDRYSPRNTKITAAKLS